MKQGVRTKKKEQKTKDGDQERHIVSTPANGTYGTVQ